MGWFTEALGLADGGDGMSSGGFGFSGGDVMGAVGGLANTGVSIWAANKTKDWAKNAADSQRRWLEGMSNSSYQRAVADMRAAGLNPALAYQQGGASTPGASAAATPEIPGDLVERGLATAKQTMAMKEELKTLQARRREAEGLARSADARANADEMYAAEDAAAKIDQAWSAGAAARASALASAANARWTTKQEGLTDLELQVQNALLPVVKARAAFDASEVGQMIYKWDRAADPAQKTTGAIGNLIGGGLRGLLGGGGTATTEDPDIEAQRRNRRGRR